MNNEDLSDIKLGSVEKQRIKYRSRFLPAIVLFFLAPIFGEYLLGILSFSEIVYVLFLAPMYGGGALLIREITRGAGRGTVTMLILGIAYGLIEEGIIDQMLFNRFYLSEQDQWDSYIAFLGIDGRLSIYVLAMHAIWSICIPIIIVESLFPERDNKPWLSRTGLGIISAIFILGSAYLCYSTAKDEKFFASTPQLIGTMIVVILLAFVSFKIGRHTSVPTTTTAPKPLVIGTVSFFASSLFMLTDSLKGWVSFSACVLLATVFFTIVYHWSSRIGWSDMHRIAIAGGGILTYAWLGLFSGSIIFGCGAIILLFVAARKLRKSKVSLLP